MIQSRLPQRDMIMGGGWGFAPDRHDTPKKEFKIPDNLPVFSKIICFDKNQLCDPPQLWNTPISEIDLYQGMIAYLLDENKMFCLINVHRQRWDDGWKEVVHNPEKQDELIRIQKLDNLLK